MLSLLFGRVFNRLIDAPPPPPPPTPSPFLVKIQRIEQMLFFCFGMENLYWGRGQFDSRSPWTVEQ